MNDFDLVLRDRLIRLEDSIPLGERRRQAPSRLTAAAAALVGAALIAGAAGAAAVIREQQVRGAPGLFNPGQPLACSGVWRMTPPEAGRYLAARGYVVTWQVENSDTRTSTLTRIPPEQGYVIEGVRNGNELTMVVEVGINARQATPPEC